MRYPNKMYISFKSSGVNSKFFINASFSTTLTGADYDNKQACSDRGANLGDVNSSSGSSDSGGSSNVPNLTTPQV